MARDLKLSYVTDDQYAAEVVRLRKHLTKLLDAFEEAVYEHAVANCNLGDHFTPGTERERLKQQILKKLS